MQRTAVGCLVEQSRSLDHLFSPKETCRWLLDRVLVLPLILVHLQLCNALVKWPLTWCSTTSDNERLHPFVSVGVVLDREDIATDLGT